MIVYAPPPVAEMEQIAELEPMQSVCSYAQATMVVDVASEPFTARLRRIEVEGAPVRKVANLQRVQRLRKLRTGLSAAWLLLGATAVFLALTGPHGYFLAPLSLMFSVTGSLIVIRRKCAEVGI